MRLRKESHEWEGIPLWSWPSIARELPPAKKTPFLKARRKGGRPRRDDRLAMSAILWRLRTGGTWDRLPERFGSAGTARRRLAHWLKGDRLERAWRAYLLQVSRVELRRWRDGLAGRDFGPRHSWRWGLDYVWRLEYAPLLEEA